MRCTRWTQRLTTGVGREEGLIFLSRKVQKKENILAVALEGPLRLQSFCQSCTAGQPLRAGNIAPVLQRARFWKLCFLTQSFLQHLLKVSSCYTQICGFFEFSWVTVYIGWIKSRCKLITSMWECLTWKQWEKKNRNLPASSNWCAKIKPAGREHCSWGTITKMCQHQVLHCAEAPLTNLLSVAQLKNCNCSVFLRLWPVPSKM